MYINSEKTTEIIGTVYHNPSITTITFISSLFQGIEGFSEDFLRWIGREFNTTDQIEATAKVWQGD